MITLGQRLKELRMAAGLSQQQLATKAGLSYSTVSKLEQGATTRPSSTILLKLSQALSFDIDAFLGAEPLKTSASGPKAPLPLQKSRFKFVYFDVGGVLLHVQPSLQALAIRLGRSYEQVLALWYTYAPLAMRGRLTQYDLQLLYLLKLNVEFKGKRRQEAFKNLVDDMVAIAPTHQFLREVATLHPVGLLTNNIDGFIDRMQQRRLLPKAHYTAIIDSSDCGLVKPEKAFFDYAAGKARVRGSDILFIDDVQVNVRAAAALGWTAEWFNEFEPEESIERIRRKHFS